jgi:hypothetical protein
MSITINDPVLGATRLGCDECGQASFHATGDDWPHGWVTIECEGGYGCYEACPECADGHEEARS